MTSFGRFSLPSSDLWHISEGLGSGLGCVLSQIQVQVRHLYARDLTKGVVDPPETSHLTTKNKWKNEKLLFKL